MAVYEIYTLDVWGNATDGYEVNNQFRTGGLMMVSTAVTESEVELDEAQHEEAQVALDYFLENGAPDERFLNGI